MSKISAARKRFDAMKAEKAAASLHPEQAALVALRQIVRDAKAGQLDLEEALEIVISEEMRCGATREAATLCANDLRDGKPCEFARRKIGEPRRQRHYAKSPGQIDPLAEQLSAELSAWANGTLGGGMR
jgi:hypothetical protein